ncbi:MAG: hypothetical protein ACTSPB_23620, partial [Candidatus Thorarchaeota archaeon]
MSGNTVKDGSGTEYRLVVDSDGYLQVRITNVSAMAGYSQSNPSYTRIQAGGGTVLAEVTSPFNNVTGLYGLITGSVIQGEDLEVGAGNSEPAKVRSDDDAIPAAEKHLIVSILHYGFDGTNWERVLTDGSGRLQTTASVVSAGAYNPETDDDSVPASEDHESNIAMLYGYDPVGLDWERLHTDSSHRLLVSVGNTVTIQDGGNVISVDDGGGSITIDDGGSPIGANIYGSQGQLIQQRATSYDILVQLRNDGAEIDPRDRNWTITEILTSRIYGSSDGGSTWYP